MAKDHERAQSPNEGSDHAAIMPVAKIMCALKLMYRAYLCSYVLVALCPFLVLGLVQSALSVCLWPVLDLALLAKLKGPLGGKPRNAKRSGNCKVSVVGWW